MDALVAVLFIALVLLGIYSARWVAKHHEWELRAEMREEEARARAAERIIKKENWK